MRTIPAALAVLLSCQAIAAQQPDAAVSAVDGSCENGFISHVFIDNHSIFDTSDPDLDSRLEWAYRLANRLHHRTKRSVIRRELLFRPGDCYDPELLQDTERLLRALGFLSDVDVYGVPQDDGSYHIVVDTQDEWSTRAEVQVEVAGGFELEGAQLLESNLLGTGQSVELFYLDRRVTSTYGVGYHTPQMFGTRWDYGLRVGSTRNGTFFDQTISYPFVGEYGRWAARQSFRRRDRFFDLVPATLPAASDTLRGSDVHLLLPVREKAMEVGLVKRFGRVGGLGLLGGALTFHEISYPRGRAGTRLVVDGQETDSMSATGPLVDPIWPGLNELQSIRAMALLGHRSISWIERSRLDAMRAAQDVRIGAEVGLAFGRSLPGLEIADDVFGTFTFFSGVPLGETLLFSTDLRVDARRDFDAPIDGPEWRDVLGEARIIGFYTPGWARRSTTVARVAAAGGWNNTTPFQLTLGGEQALRGYDDIRYPGGRRVVLTLEERLYLGWPFPDLIDLGVTAHVDAGRIWPGDLPAIYGTDSGWRASGGLGLRANFPAGGRTTYRVDYAVPFEGGLGGGRLLISVGEVIGLNRPFERPEVLRSRLSSLSGDVFNFHAEP